MALQADPCIIESNDQASTQGNATNAYNQDHGDFRQAR
jgi:hypothetical protein